MTTFRKNVLIALASLSLGAAAIGAEVQAPQDHPGHMRMSQEQRQAKMAEFAARREAALHAALKLSPDQEPAWNAFAAAVRPVPHVEGDRAQWASLSAPARLQQMIERSKRRTATMEAHLSALNAFYSTLSPEQKQVLDQHMEHEHMREHMMRERGMRQHGEKAQG